jgi:hypothetical protein
LFLKFLFRNFSSGPNSCADDFLELVKARLGHRDERKPNILQNMVRSLKYMSLGTNEVGSCCNLKKTCQKVDTLRKGLIQYVRPELDENELPKWVCDKKNQQFFWYEILFLYFFKKII